MLDRLNAVAPDPILGIIAGFSHQTGRPKTQQFVSSCACLELKFLIVGKLALKAFFPLVKIAHSYMCSIVGAYQYGSPRHRQSIRHLQYVFCGIARRRA